jgi:quercetin dioxygenase-like cupin family protein
MIVIGSVLSNVSPYLSGFDEGEVKWFLGCQVWHRASVAQTGGTFALVEQIVPPGGGSPFHIHRNEDEAFYLLEGEIRFFIGDQSWVLGPGGFAFLPRGIAHGFRTEGDAPSHSLLLATPGGLEQFVAELSTPLPPAGPPDLAVLLATAAKYGIEILGPLPE